MIDRLNPITRVIQKQRRGFITVMREITDELGVRDGDGWFSKDRAIQANDCLRWVCVAMSATSNIWSIFGYGRNVTRICNIAIKAIDDIVAMTDSADARRQLTETRQSFIDVMEPVGSNRSS